MIEKRETVLVWTATSEKGDSGVQVQLKKVRWSGLSVDFFGPNLRLQLASANRRNQQRVKLCTMGEVEVCKLKLSWSRFSVYLQQTGHLVHNKGGSTSCNAQSWQLKMQNVTSWEISDLATTIPFHLVQIRVQSAAVKYWKQLFLVIFYPHILTRMVQIFSHRGWTECRRGLVCWLVVGFNGQSDATESVTCLLNRQVI